MKLRENQFKLKFRKTLITATDKMLVIMKLEILKEQEKRQKELRNMKESK